ncbi:MAG: malto-oligosyltrehalose trehalohydrolase [Candidatus Phosphoribacter sp.]
MTRDDRIRVWAPAATLVDLDLAPVGGVVTTTPMDPASGGWWVERPGQRPAYGDDGAVSASYDYAFRVDGGEPRPDPRSPWQPQGVHEASRTFDAGAYRWRDTRWRGPRGGDGAIGGVIYELHIGTFTGPGTFEAAIGRLDHLVALGVDVVEVMPVAAFEGRWGWGYDGVALYAVHHPYGGPVALQHFVNACHERGLGVCLDVVYNHVGASGSYLQQFGPYFTAAHETPWGEAVNLDTAGSETVREFLVENALRWFRDFHVDALRIDAVHELHDDSPRHLLAQLSDAVAELSTELGRPLALIAESDLNDPVMITPTSEGGRGMGAQWADDVHHALHAALTHESEGYYADFLEPGALSTTLTQAFLHDGRWSSFRGQSWGVPVDTSVHRRNAFLAYLQSHDQIGNGAVGERISSKVTPGQQALAAAVYLLSGFTPMIFMGEEWAASTPWQFFTDFEDAELGDAITEGRLEEFAGDGRDDDDDVPDPQRSSTRRRSVLDWGERADPSHQRMFGWYSKLIAVRRAQPHLTDVVLDEAAVTENVRGGQLQWLVLSHGRLRVVCNFGTQTALVPLLEGPDGAELLLAWDPGSTRHTPGVVELGGHCVAVLEVR